MTNEPDFSEIAEALGYPPAEDLPYTVSIITEPRGKRITRLKFKSFEALEQYFIEQLIGCDLMKGCASKVIGTTLLIWDRN